MHRQSLGSSPSSKLVVKDEHLSFESPKHSSPPPSTFGSGYEGEEAAKKSMKAKHNYTMAVAPEIIIHFIPILTLICFLILYLSSHDPSPFDLADFNVPESFSNPDGIKKGDILAIRSLKNLEHEASGRAKHRMLHRKIAHF